MLALYLSNVRHDLFEGKITPVDYDNLVKQTLREALSAHRITYTEWAQLYYQYIG